MQDFIGKTEIKLLDLVKYLGDKAVIKEDMTVLPKTAGCGLQFKEGDVITLLGQPVIKNVDGEGVLDERGNWRPGAYWVAKTSIEDASGSVLADEYSFPLGSLWTKGKEYPSMEKAVIPAGMIAPVPNRFGRELLAAEGLSNYPFSSRLQLLENETLKVAYLWKEIGGLGGSIRIKKVFTAFNIKFAPKETRERIQAAEGRQWGSKESDWKQTPVLFCEVASRGNDFAEEDTPETVTATPETTAPEA